MKASLLIFVVFLIACSSTVELSENSSEEVLNVSDSIKEEKSLKDLSIEIVTGSAYPEKDSLVEFKILINNVGFKTINQTVDFKVSFENYSFSGTTDLFLFPATKVVAHEFNFSVDKYGTFKASAEVDSEDNLNELDETNNEDSLKVYVKEPEVEEIETNSESSLNSEEGCSDSDYGKRTGVVGTCTDSDFPNGRKDFCTDDDSVAETYCKSDRCQIEVIECDNACIDGKCY